MTPVDLASRALYRGVTFASTRPPLYYGLRRLSGRLDDLCVGPQTELVIEGYPRSANSTTVAAFLARQPRPVVVAHHKHHAAQLLRAAQRGLPAAVLIRRPDKAVLSHLALIEESRQREGRSERVGSLGLVEVLGSYLAFYRAVEPILDRLIIAPFDEVTADVGPMIDELNARFGTRFATAAPQSASVELGWHALPNDRRDRIKDELATQFQLALASSRRLRYLMSEANNLHQRFLEQHERRR